MSPPLQQPHSYTHRHGHMLAHTLHVTTSSSNHTHACTHTHVPPTHAHLLMRPSTRCQVGTSVLKIVSMLGIRLAL